MQILRALLVILCALALGAHFLRSSDLLLVTGVLAMIPLALVPRPWAWWTLRVGLILGALEWVRTLLVLRAARMADGAPYLRMVLLLSAVTLLTAFAGWWAGVPRREGPELPSPGSPNEQG